MSASLKGDISKLGRLTDNLRRLAEVPSRSSKFAAEQLATAIDHQFTNGVDPYGNPWAPLKPSTLKKGRTPPPLTDTHATRDSVDVTPMSGAGIKVTIDFPAEIHQKGSENMEARKIFPEGPFPIIWDQAIRYGIQVVVDDSDPEK